jgi:hypothetical protein
MSVVQHRHKRPINKFLDIEAEVSDEDEEEEDEEEEGAGTIHSVCLMVSN